MKRMAPYLVGVVLLIGLWLGMIPMADADDTPITTDVPAATDAAPTDAVSTGTAAADVVGTDAVSTDAASTAVTPIDAATSDQANADEVLDTPDEVISTTRETLSAFQSKTWPVAIGGVLLLVVYILRRFGALSGLPSELVPWVTLILALISAVASGLFHQLSWIDIIIDGLIAATVAMGGWDLTKVLRTSKADDTSGSAPGA